MVGTAVSTRVGFRGRGTSTKEGAPERVIPTNGRVHAAPAQTSGMERMLLRAHWPLIGIFIVTCLGGLGSDSGGRPSK